MVFSPVALMNPLRGDVVGSGAVTVIVAVSIPDPELGFREIQKAWVSTVHGHEGSLADIVRGRSPPLGPNSRNPGVQVYEQFVWVTVKVANTPADPGPPAVTTIVPTRVISGGAAEEVKGNTVKATVAGSSVERIWMKSLLVAEDHGQPAGLVTGKESVPP
jgi:hypothetical protein